MKIILSIPKTISRNVKKSFENASVTSIKRLTLFIEENLFTKVKKILNFWSTFHPIIFANEFLINLNQSY